MADSQSRIDRGDALVTRKKIHELTMDELENYPVSEHCHFRDNKWPFTNKTAGGPRLPALDWNIELTDGTILSAPQHAVRLRWAKILLLTILIRPAKLKAPKAGSIPTFRTAFKYFMSWMSISCYYHPSELTPVAVRSYIEWVTIELTSRLDGEVGDTACFTALSILKRLWDQRTIMSEMGIEVMRSHPFEGETINSVANGMATQARTLIAPLPDEVAIPLLNIAAWFLGTPADDVLRLLEAVRDPLAGKVTNYVHQRSGGTYYTVRRRNGVGLETKNKRARKFLASFKFSTAPNESGPWHPPFDLTHAKKGPNPAFVRMCELWDSVQAAALIVIQATSGMRASELLGINAGVDEDTGLPIGVRVEKSVTGLYEWFVIRSDLFKTELGLPREVDWVLGMRPVGSTEIPLAVNALILLNKISEPWRRRAKTPYLVLASAPGKTLPIASAVLGPISNSQLNDKMKRFIKRWVDLSELPDESVRKSEDLDLVRWRESGGTIFRTHMLRKSWAQYALACDSRLLPVIQMQFHHLSLAMTEGGYIGRNPMLLEALDSVSVQKRNLLIFETVIGRNSLAGRMGEQLERSLEPLRAEICDLPTSEKWKKSVEWADRNDLTLFFTAHATCSPTQTSQMRCHDAADTPVWIRAAPNTTTREPSMCAGCACAIMDTSHEPFWSERYVTS